MRRPTTILAIIATAALAAAGCGSSDKSKSSSSSASGGADKAVAAQVPAKFKSKTLTAGTDPTYAPNEFVAPDGKTIEGMDVDLANALGDVMGVKMNVVKATFDSIIPGLASGKYVIGISSFTDTREREKTVDFVTYFEAGTSFYAKAQGAPTITGLADLCGHKVAVEKGTTQQDDSTKQGKKCRAAGKPGVTVLTFPDQNGANLAISSGRADIGMADSPVADYQVKKGGGQFKLIGKEYGPFPYGIAIPKNSGLAKPILAALKVLIKNGKYQAILNKWGIASGGITSPAINKAIS